jgi:heme/copper-type cytochrome/quinol oxidase subunit 2
MRLYFRTRVATLIALGLLLLGSFIMVLVNSEKLAAKDAYDLTRTYVILMAFIIFMTWLGVDLYWSIAIRTYKDTKKGKKGEEVAKKLSKTIDPNNFIMDNVKETRYNSSIED